MIERMGIKNYWTYIMASPSGTLYVGVTNNLVRRVSDHKNGLKDGFTKRYGCHKLVYFECVHDAAAAIKREKQIKRWGRYKKQELIRMKNPAWRDLSDEWPLFAMMRKGSLGSASLRSG